MGAVVFSIQDFYDQTSEIVGLKSGILLNDYIVNKILKEKFYDYFLDLNENTTIIRVRSKEAEAMIRHIRIRIGNLPEEPKINYYMILNKYLRTMEDYRLNNLYMGIAIELYRKGELTYVSLHQEVSKNKDLNSELVDALVYTIMERVDDSIFFPHSRTLDQPEPIQSLFKEEILPQSDNTFIDQKFVDYLAVNGKDIEEIHWRNFERLVANILKDKDSLYCSDRVEKMRVLISEFLMKKIIKTHYC